MPQLDPPIRAVCFDLDGTLVETERLKALSYAHAVAALRPGPHVAEDVVAAYAELAGRSREVIAAALIERFALDVPPPVFLASRLRAYDEMVADHALIRAQAYAPTIALLRDVRARGYATGMATMSRSEHARGILEILGLGDAFDAQVARDEVTAPKPDPEIYLALAERLGVAPAVCPAIEDSLPGVQSALAAGMTCVAATTDLTRAVVRAANVLPASLIVDSPDDLAGVVNGILEARAQ